MLSIGFNAFHAFFFYFHSLLLSKYLLHKTIQIKGGGDMIEVMLSFFYNSGLWCSCDGVVDVVGGA